MAAHRIFWGETHDNTHQFAELTVPFSESCSRAASHLDFYAAAYYTARASAFQAGGHLSESQEPTSLVLEEWKAPARLKREWADVQATTKALNRPGSFITFPGYEWQGDGSPGDHNVVFLEEGAPVFRVQTLSELYDCLRNHDAIAIPHHTGYRPGIRGRNWSVYDEALSPFAELYSIHGSSETDEEWIGLRHNPHMGPGISGGTYQDALDRGLHLGAICSTDNWGEMPGHYGHGRMACLAKELTRKSLWEAFRARRVYGVTGDRIQIDFRINDAPMGAIISVTGKRVITVNVVGCDAIDRIELLRNGRVIATHCHQGTWTMPADGQSATFKMRIEAGWGPRNSEIRLPDRTWHGEMRIPGGRLIDCEPCWISPGQGQPALAGDRAAFTMVSSAKHLGGRTQNANVFEFEAQPDQELSIRMNELEERGRVLDFASGSREMWFGDECVSLLAEKAGIAPGSPERQDIYHHVAYKAKLHRPIPKAGYTARLFVEDDEPLAGEANYRVRVEQRNAQRAWSSPIWVRDEAT